MRRSKLIKILIIATLVIVSLGIGAFAAYTYKASDVTYGGTTVEAALNDLYTKLPTKSIGDEVTVGGEQFYVLGWDNNRDTVDLIAKYNLNFAGNAQSSTKYECVFSSKDYWSSSFTSSPFNLNDFIGFTSTDALGKAKSYGRSKGAVSSRLLSYEEANALKTKSSSNTKIKSMYANGQFYWLGSAYSTAQVYYVSYDGHLRDWSHDMYDTEDTYGVRPVITVLKSNIS